MAFTTPQKLTIGVILGKTPLQLDDHFAVFPVSADVETAVETELARWAVAGAKFLNIHPMERNYGVEINAGLEKSDIRKNIALLLGFDLDSLGFGGRLVRG